MIMTNDRANPLPYAVSVSQEDVIFVRIPPGLILAGQQGRALYVKLTLLEDLGFDFLPSRSQSIIK